MEVTTNTAEMASIAPRACRLVRRRGRSSVRARYMGASVSRIPPSHVRHVGAMAKAFPAYTYRTAENGTGIWAAEIVPLPSTSDADLILDDLANDRQVVLQDGVGLAHLSTCNGPHGRAPWLERFKGRATTYRIEVRYGGGRAMPRCLVVSPELPRTPDKWMHRLPPDGAMCAFFGPKVWKFPETIITELIPDYVMWLAKWSVFDESGIWIGSAMRHDPESHLKEIPGDAFCWCGGGRKYKNCHRPDEQRAVWASRRTG